MHTWNRTWMENQMTSQSFRLVGKGFKVLEPNRVDAFFHTMAINDFLCYNYISEVILEHGWSKWKMRFKNNTEWAVEMMVKR